jgi:hypothetical protein
MYRSSLAWRETIVKALQKPRHKIQVGDKSAYIQKMGARDDSIIMCWSYNTPVAYLEKGTFYATLEKFSVTTSRHLRNFISTFDLPVVYVHQKDIAKKVLRRKQCPDFTRKT